MSTGSSQDAKMDANDGMTTDAVAGVVEKGASSGEAVHTVASPTERALAHTVAAPESNAASASGARESSEGAARADATVRHQATCVLVAGENDVSSPMVDGDPATAATADASADASVSVAAAEAAAAATTAAVAAETSAEAGNAPYASALGASSTTAISVPDQSAAMGDVSASTRDESGPLARQAVVKEEPKDADTDGSVQNVRVPVRPPTLDRRLAVQDLAAFRSVARK